MARLQEESGGGKKSYPVGSPEWLREQKLLADQRNRQKILDKQKQTAPRPTGHLEPQEIPLPSGDTATRNPVNVTPIKQPINHLDPEIPLPSGDTATQNPVDNTPIPRPTVSNKQNSRRLTGHLEPEQIPVSSGKTSTINTILDRPTSNGYTTLQWTASNNNLSDPTLRTLDNMSPRYTTETLSNSDDLNIRDQTNVKEFYTIGELQDYAVYIGNLKEKGKDGTDEYNNAIYNLSKGIEKIYKSYLENATTIDPITLNLGYHSEYGLVSLELNKRGNGYRVNVGELSFQYEKLDEALQKGFGFTLDPYEGKLKAETFEATSDNYREQRNVDFLNTYVKNQVAKRGNVTDENERQQFYDDIDFRYKIATYAIVPDLSKPKEEWNSLDHAFEDVWENLTNAREMKTKSYTIYDGLRQEYDDTIKEINQYIHDENWNMMFAQLQTLYYSMAAMVDPSGISLAEAIDSAIQGAKIEDASEINIIYWKEIKKYKQYEITAAHTRYKKWDKEIDKWSDVANDFNYYYLKNY